MPRRRRGVETRARRTRVSGGPPGRQSLARTKDMRLDGRARDLGLQQVRPRARGLDRRFRAPGALPFRSHSTVWTTVAPAGTLRKRAPPLGQSAEDHTCASSSCGLGDGEHRALRAEVCLAVGGRGVPGGDPELRLFVRCVADLRPQAQPQGGGCAVGERRTGRRPAGRPCRHRCPRSHPPMRRSLLHRWPNLSRRPFRRLRRPTRIPRRRRSRSRPTRRVRPGVGRRRDLNSRVPE